MDQWLKPTDDMFVKYLLGSESHKPLLISFLNALLVHQGFKPVEQIEIKNPFSLRDFQDQKESILDIKAKEISGRWFDIEVQVDGQPSYLERSLYYWSRMYSNQLSKGKEYNAIVPAIGIHVLSFVAFPEISEAVNTFMIKHQTLSDVVLTDHLVLHYIEIPKIDKPDLNDKLSRWMAFFKLDTLGGEAMTQLIHKDQDIKQAYNLYEGFLADEKARLAYESHLKWVNDQASKVALAEERGIEKGIEKGELKGMHKVAKTMKLSGYPGDEISKMTGLTVDEISRL